MLLPILLLFIAHRAIHVIAAVFAPLFIPYLGFFPYADILKNSGLPQWLYSFANFDGVHYLIIAERGYQTYQEAFFPLYPIVIKFLTPAAEHGSVAAFLISGLAASQLLFLGGVILFYTYSRSVWKNRNTALWSCIFLLSFPTAFYFGAVYSESLFLVCAIGYIYAVHKQKYWIASLLGYAAAMTRLIGVFLLLYTVSVLIIPYLQNYMPTRRAERKIIFNLHKFPSIAAALASPLLGLASYMLYLFYRTGDALYFFSAQPAFGANRSTELILLPQVMYRYIKIFTTASPNFQYFVAFVEFVLFMLVMFLLMCEFWKIITNWKRDGIAERTGLLLFSTASMILPTLTGTLSSTPRYALMALPIFYTLGTLQGSWIKSAAAFIFAALQIILLGFFIQGYFVG